MAHNRFLMDAIILAAGRGERMKPLTDTTPKPLLNAGARRLIEHQLIALQQAGVSHIVINVAHLAAQFEPTLGDGSRYGVSLTYSYEPEGALETAGGIAYALSQHLVLSDPFIVANGDVYTNFDYRLLKLDAADDCCLVMVDNPNFHPEGDFTFAHDRLSHIDSSGTKLTFSGIGIYRQRLFQHIGNRDNPRRHRLAPVLRHAIERDKVSALHHHGEWISVDTVSRLDRLHLRLTKLHDGDMN